MCGEAFEQHILGTCGLYRLMHRQNFFGLSRLKVRPPKVSALLCAHVNESCPHA